jgi:amino acid transporter
MENQQKPTKQIMLNYGVILGFASILISVANYALGNAYNQDWKVSLLGFLVMAAIIVFGIKKYKEANGGLLSLGEGLKTGVGIALIGGVISIIYTIIFMTYIEPDFMENTMELARQKMMDNPNMSEETIDAAINMQKKFSSPAMIAGFGLLWVAFLGFVISLIASLIMKKTEEQ